MSRHLAGILGRIVGTAATAAAVLTAVAVVGWLVFSQVTGATLVTFRTGSMSPTMPQGALAVSLPVTAAEIRQGDVVTVPRTDNGRPVTHRVVSVSDPSDPAAPAQARQLVLKGDANLTVDRRPYVVTEARRVVASVPHAGAVLETVRSPLGMATLTLLLGALVMWALWPQGDTAPARPRPVRLPARHVAPRAR